MLNHVLIVWDTDPRFLTQSVVGCQHLFNVPGAAIFAFIFSSSTISMHNIIHCFLVAWIVGHVIHYTSIQFHSLPGMKNIIEVWHDPLECHGSIKGTNNATPSTTGSKVSF
ncbi:expressed unknown protein [Seminavis robusta]|uniref:Uncharacterized protein n=1 Tax=Seminavis robusta TaxID=568900 RepID=A0A9N8HQK0_9STRA|nr:expressed unknown protein [Seminavis robusta]|eukprot:Sro1451_g273862.1  (111) ;mRNA; r:21471-21803